MIISKINELYKFWLSFIFNLKIKLLISHYTEADEQLVTIRKYGVVESKEEGELEEGELTDEEEVNSEILNVKEEDMKKMEDPNSILENVEKKDTEADNKSIHSEEQVCNEWI